MSDFLETCETILKNINNREMISNFIKYFCKYNNFQILKFIFTNLSPVYLDKYIENDIESICLIQDMDINDIIIKNGVDPKKFLVTKNINNNFAMINYLLKNDHDIVGLFK